MSCVKQHVCYVTSAIVLGMVGMYFLLPKNSKEEVNQQFKKLMKKKDKMVLDMVE